MAGWGRQLMRIRVSTCMGGRLPGGDGGGGHKCVCVGGGYEYMFGVCVCTCVRACVRACERTCLRLRECARARLYVGVRARTCVCVEMGGGREREREREKRKANLEKGNTCMFYAEQTFQRLALQSHPQTQTLYPHPYVTATSPLSYSDLLPFSNITLIYT